MSCCMQKGGQSSSGFRSGAQPGTLEAYVGEILMWSNILTMLLVPMYLINGIFAYCYQVPLVNMCLDE